MFKRTLISLLSFLPLLAYGSSIELRQGTVEGKAVGTVNDNFRRLEQDKLDKRQTQALIDESVTTGGSLSSVGAFKNRIINGDMRIDQRNSGAAVTVNSTTDQFPVDRFNGSGQATDGVFTLQQTTTVVPSGFRYAVKATVTTADASIGATQNYAFRQHIEGYNIQDAGFGTSWAKELTLSFWVYSSVTGTFGGAFLNNASNRSYPFTYAINAANTWEQKTVTFTADTTGTWETTNLRGVNINWSLGAGSTYLGAADAWAGTTYYGATGQTNLIATLNATWYLTGVQVEIGDTATAFERRSIGTEVDLCMRYYYRAGYGASGMSQTATVVVVGAPHPTTMRSSPTMALVKTAIQMRVNGSSSTTSSGSAIQDSAVDVRGWWVTVNGFSGLSTRDTIIHAFDTEWIEFHAEL